MGNLPCVAHGISMSYCGEAAEVTIPERINGLLITEVGSDAFSGNQHLTHLHVPATITDWGIEVFYGCDHLVQVTCAKHIDPVVFEGSALDTD